jgi:hypothetical protein
MKKIKIEKFFRSKAAGNTIIITASVILIYLLISIYFAKHFFFNTVVNGADVSLKSHEVADNIIRNYIKDYKLILRGRDGETEKIAGQEIALQYNEQSSIYKIYLKKSSIMWLSSLFKAEKYYVSDLFIYNKEDLEDKINDLNCINKVMVEPQNVSFKYTNGSYAVVKEVYGNKINRDKLNEVIREGISEGETEIDLNEKFCYENPKYTLNSKKTFETLNLLNKYVKAKITYIFDSEKEVLDENTINQWLCVNENLDVIISEMEVMRYVRALSKKYDTVGIARDFITSTGKIVEVNGGLYGWKINQALETKVLLENIRLGKTVEKEPIYTQKALPRGKNEIGNTYVEINLTKQHLWFYKNGRLITQGKVVTGNPNRGNSTVSGTYMLNYKQKGANLRGPGYEAGVTYWMPFFGNIGIHDASWRYSFGGEIYKRNGSHGCVNAPLYLAKNIFENIEAGTPIVCYQE